MNEQYKAVITLDEVMETDEEVIKRVSNDFITKEGISAYTLFVELNDRWKPYINTERKIQLQGKITDAACQRYYKRYKKEILISDKK